MKQAFAVGLLLLLAACASAPSSPRLVTSPADDDLRVPASAPQASLVIGHVPPGTKVELQEAAPPASAATPVPTTALRVSAQGVFAFGIGREAAGTKTLVLRLPGGKEVKREIAIVARSFPKEFVDGVPETTVNPPPEIAARIEREQAAVNAARTRDDDRDDFEAKFIWPVTGRISGRFGSERVYNGTPKSPHSGMDIAAAQGTPVRAPAGGIVTFADPGLYLTGGTLLIDHGHGISSNFLHLSRIDVKVGDRVEQGQAVGAVGATGRATGPHLHWGMNWFAVRVDPMLLVDPAGNPQ